MRWVVYALKHKYLNIKQLHVKQCYFFQDHISELMYADVLLDEAAGLAILDHHPPAEKVTQTNPAVGERGFTVNIGNDKTWQTKCTSLQEEGFKQLAEKPDENKKKVEQIEKAWLNGHDEPKVGKEN